MSKRSDRRRWSEETIISLIKDWVAKYGDPPTAMEWNLDPEYPTAASVNHYFGNWKNAMIAAGVKRPRGRGCPSHLIQPSPRKNGKFVPVYGTA